MDLTLDLTSDERPAKEDGSDGYSAVTIFHSPAGCQGLTYDDIILMPGKWRPLDVSRTARYCPSVGEGVAVH